MQEQIQAHFEVMGTFVSEYERVIRAKQSLEEQLDVLKSEKNKHETKAKEEVYNAVDENTKKKYTNEEMRNIASVKSLESNEDYLKIKGASDRLENEVSKLRLEIDILLKRISVCSKQADLIVALANYKSVTDKNEV